MENMDIHKPSAIERKEKPEVLYVAAQIANIKELTPQRGRYREEEEGPVIFSTPDKALASVFLIKGCNDSWIRIGYFAGIPYVAICMDKDKFIKNDRGGTIYEVPSDTFNYNPNLGMGDKEWTSSKPVKPIKETFYPSALETMIESGINVYFVNKKIFNAIDRADDHGLRILLSLPSENQKRGAVIKPLQDLLKKHP